VIQRDTVAIRERQPLAYAISLRAAAVYADAS
jgi:hypothetical protein